MTFLAVTLALISLVAYTVAAGYGTGGASYGSGPSSLGGGVPTYGRGSGSVGQGKNEAPKPYSFEYNAADEEGNTHYRSEQGDQNGRVKGMYGYTDAQGLYRVVEYEADENGYRAKIRTNEPGVDGKESPADVLMTAEQPPAGIQGASAGGYRTPNAGSRGYSGGSRAAKPASGKSGY